MARRFSVARTRGRVAKRKTVWIGTATAAQVQIGAGLSVIHSSFTPDSLAMLAPTVVRTRGFAIFFPTAFGADRSSAGAYGLGVVSDEAFAAGAASIPRPHDDDDWPGWLVHGYFANHLEFQSATSEHQTPFGYEIDSKAMRKIGVNETLVWMVEDNSGTAVEVILQARVLMMLS